jgi:PadR family transcriptional regulator PadR
MPSEKTDLLQGALDMLVLKIAALGPIREYAISQRMPQISRDVLQVQQGPLYALTKAGRKRLEMETTPWARLAEAIGLILRTVESIARKAVLGGM